MVQGNSVTGRRVAAACIDLVPLVFVVVALSDRSSRAGHAELTLSGWSFLLGAIVVLGYSFVCEALTATTPGKRIMDLVVVDMSGNAPSTGAIAARTALRIIDALPAFYLVGFIVVLASPNHQRVGDMVASTRVVRRSETEAAAPKLTARTSEGILAIVALVTFVIGIVAFVGRGDHESTDDRVGRFEYTEDVVPVVDRLMREGLGSSSADAFMDVMAPGAATEQQTSDALDQIAGAAGEWSGEYSIDQHMRAADATFTQLGPDPLEVMEVYVDTAYASGNARVRLAFVDLDGSLRLISWNVRPT